jgi:hypothetical protein
MVGHAISLIPKKFVLNIHSLKLVIKIDFGNKIFGRGTLGNRFQWGKFNFDNISIKFRFW